MLPAVEKKRSIESDCDLVGEVKVAKIGGGDGQRWEMDGNGRDIEVAPNDAEALTEGKWNFTLSSGLIQMVIFSP